MMTKTKQIEKLAKHCHQLLLVALCVAPLALTAPTAMADNIFSPSADTTEEYVNAPSAKKDSLSDMLNDHVVRSQSFGTLVLAHFKTHISDLEESSEHPETGMRDEKYKFNGSDITYVSDGAVIHSGVNIHGSKNQYIVYSINGNDLTISASDDSDCHGKMLSSVTYKLHNVAKETHGKDLILYPETYRLEDSSHTYIVPKSKRSEHSLNLHTKSRSWEHANENDDAI